MEINTLQRDVDASEDGVYFPFGDDGKAQVKIAQWMNKEHSKFLREIGKKYGMRISRGVMADEEARQIMAQQWQYIIKDIKGFTENGKEVKYSPELITRWALDRKLTDFFTDVEEISKDSMNYREENVKSLGEALRTMQSGPTDGPSKKKDS